MALRQRKRYLIVKADDFGQSAGVNRGIIEAHQSGIVTSASLMVRWPAAVEAAAYARNHPALSLGLHFDFGEWFCRRGKWTNVYEVVPDSDLRTAAREASRQLTAFRSLVGRDPSHLDSHQHVHRRIPLRPLFAAIAKKLKVPLREGGQRVRYLGEFYGQTSTGKPLRKHIGTAAFITLLMKLQPGFTELGCHPGYADDLDTMYCEERQKEIQTLCDPKVRAAVRDLAIELCSFRDVPVTYGGFSK